MTPDTITLRRPKILMSTIFVFALIFSQNANAFVLNIDKLEVKKPHIDLSFETSLFEATTSYLPFKEPDFAEMVGYMKDKYLTFYSNKYEKLNATYSGGMYYLKYTHNW